ncbi:MAG TPA: anaerobic C4-dicarboxylate transporter family protein [Myxococcota bacterium]
MWVELALLLACIVVGARLGGMALGPVAGIGLVILVFAFGEPPGAPPGTVLGMILAVVTALALMQAAGGLDYVVELAEGLLRRNPKRITLVAPLVTYALIAASGTQHVIYALLPVIAEVARKAGVRPERPLSISVIAAQHGLIASPISAATVALAGVIAGSPVGVPQILLVTIPATLAGVLAGTLSVAFRGAELASDPAYQRALAEGKLTDASSTPRLEGANRRRAQLACGIFVAAILAVVLLGVFPELRPVFEHSVDGAVRADRIEMGRAIMIVMLAAGGALLVAVRADPEKALRGSIMKGGLTAVISILGVSWLGSSFFEGNQQAIVGGISAIVEAHPWVFAAGLFVLSILLFSQAATIVTLGPVAIALGLPASFLLAAYPAVNGNFFLPTYGTVLAAVSFDATGTTRIGGWLLNHSFMRPGLVATAVATAAATVLSRWLLPT